MKNLISTLGAGSLLSAAALLGMTGCSANFGAIPASAHAGLAISGNVHGGQQAVVGAKVYLYAVGTGGLGTASASRLNNPGYVVSGQGGSFDITGDYTCQAGDQLYLLALGGNPGLAAASTNNTYISLMTALGACSTLSTTQFVTINEVTTTAAVYALSQFMASPTSIASSSSPAGILGITHAFATASNLANTATGIANTTTAAGNGTVDQARINTLADAIAPCINSAGTTGSGDPCPTLSMTATGSATTITDTASALLATARNPYFNPSGIFGLATATAPFQPTLTAAPDAFVMPITYTGGGLEAAGAVNPSTGVAQPAAPGDLSINSNGDVWVVSLVANSIAAFKNDGTPISGATGFSGNGVSNPGAAAWDASGHLDVTDFNSNVLSVFDSTGKPLGTTGGGGINGPGNIATDSNGNLWVVNQDGSVTEYNSGFTPVSPAQGGFNYNLPLAYVATDMNGHAFFTGGNVTLKVDGTGKDLSNGGFPTCPGSAFSANAVSTDSLNQPWVQCTDSHNSAPSGVSTANETVVNLDATGNVNPHSIQASQQLVNYIDAANNVWILDTDRSRLQEMNSRGVVLTANIQTSATNPSPYGISDGIYKPQAVRADSSGNLWISNVYQQPTTTPTGLIEFVGLAAPTKTPLFYGAVTP